MFKRKDQELRDKWAKKVKRAKYFAVLTDESSCLFLEGVDPESTKDRNALISQAVMLETFIERLSELSAQHSKLLEKKASKKKTKTTKSKKATSIKVKEG